MMHVELTGSCLEIYAGLGVGEKISALRSAWQQRSSGLLTENILTNPWLILAGACIIFILTMILISIHHYRLEQAKQAAGSARGNADKNTAVEGIIKPTSRLLAAGKKVQIVPADDNGSSGITCEVTGNYNDSWTLRSEIAVLTEPGQKWFVRYLFGTGAWQFDVMVLSSSGRDIVFSHTESVQYMNRRRFLRVPVNKPAVIASFPLIREFSADEKMVPDFANAVVTEVSGPGLKIETDFELSAADRIVVVFEIEPGRLIEETAIVRWVKNTGFKYLMGIELVNMAAAGVSRMVETANKESALDSMMKIRQVEMTAQITEAVND